MILTIGTSEAALRLSWRFLRSARLRLCQAHLQYNKRGTRTRSSQMSVLFRVREHSGRTFRRHSFRLSLLTYSHVQLLGLPNRAVPHFREIPLADP